VRSSTPSAGVVRVHRAALAVLAVLLLTVAACTNSDAAQAPVATTQVQLPKSYRFEPAAITIPAGATVTWRNDDNFTHNVTFDGEDSLAMSPGDTATRTFATPGTYAYQCTLHPQDMQGTVEVTGS
jgi:plastocyanin